MKKKDMGERSRFEMVGSEQTKSEEELRNGAVSRGEESKWMRNLTKAMSVLVVCTVGFVLFSAMKDPSPNGGSWTALDDFKHIKKDEPDQILKDKLLVGLPPQGFDENSDQIPKDKLFSSPPPQGFDENSDQISKEKLLGSLPPQGFYENSDQIPKDKLLSGLPPQGFDENSDQITKEKLSGSLPPQGFNENSDQIPKDKLLVGLPSQGFDENADKIPKDKLLGGLLPQGFDENSCVSRYQEVLYHKQQIKQPSSHLISRLRNYEALHKRCGPYTGSYNRTMKYLKSGKYNGKTTDCNYVIWTASNGLGNKMITIVSAFLYALLTNRILLVEPKQFIPDLFCEPFPEVSWLLPPDFPLVSKIRTFDQSSRYSFGDMLSRNVFGKSTFHPPYVYLHLLPNFNYHDQLFFCDQQQTLLQKVPWLILKTSNYFTPSLFLMQYFQGELNNLFPEKSAVFHLLGRYLFHPTNSVWGLITRYYKAHLARADEITGIQIRTFKKGPGPFKYVTNQILDCVRKENLLPEINHDKKPVNLQFYKEHNKSTKAVLITSLSSGYFEALRDVYGENRTETGDIVQVFQPSHDERQQTYKNKTHNMKALAEIYLLSMTDKLVTSSRSTFGYVAQSLGDLKPWILTKYGKNYTAVPGAPCRRSGSTEPCFHYPPSHQCGSKREVNIGKIVPHVHHCEDKILGLKLFDTQ